MWCVCGYVGQEVCVYMYVGKLLIECTCKHKCTCFRKCLCVKVREHTYADISVCECSYASVCVRADSLTDGYIVRKLIIDRSEGRRRCR